MKYVDVRLFDETFLFTRDFMDFFNEIKSMSQNWELNYGKNIPRKSRGHGVI